MAEPHVHDVQIYYEDTDFTGVVYHANYLKYMERAREHMLGVEALTTLYDTEGVGFAVYKATCTYREGAKHGDTIEVRTIGKLESGYRIVFKQDVYRKRDQKLLVEGEIHLVCIDKALKLVALPAVVVDGMKIRFPD